LVEVHPAPDKAFSDGAQSLDIPQFAKMMQELRPYLALWKEARVTPATAAV
jgi:3-deoxy-7-phosphoheptulonate synthase